MRQPVPTHDCVARKQDVATNPRLGGASDATCVQNAVLLLLRKGPQGRTARFVPQHRFADFLAGTCEPPRLGRAECPNRCAFSHGFVDAGLVPKTCRHETSFASGLRRASSTAGLPSAASRLASLPRWSLAQLSSCTPRAVRASLSPGARRLLCGFRACALRRGRFLACTSLVCVNGPLCESVPRFRLLSCRFFFPLFDRHILFIIF
jgi:hypothetical protein